MSKRISKIWWVWAWSVTSFRKWVSICRRWARCSINAKSLRIISIGSIRALGFNISAKPSERISPVSKITLRHTNSITRFILSIKPNRTNLNTWPSHNIIPKISTGTSGHTKMQDRISPINARTTSITNPFRRCGINVTEIVVWTGGETCFVWCVTVGLRGGCAGGHAEAQGG